MRRRLHTFLASASLLMAVALLALWIDSRVHAYCEGHVERMWLTRDRYYRRIWIWAGSGNGVLAINLGSQTTNDANHYPVKSPDFLPRPQYRSRFFRADRQAVPSLMGEHPGFWDSLGFKRSDPILGLGQTARGFGAPYWFLVLLCLLLPARWFWQRRRRPLPGHCPDCGYDLRATPDRCPECGRATAPPSHGLPARDQWR